MANVGILPGDLIVSDSVAPGLTIMQPLDLSRGYKQNTFYLNTGAYTQLDISPDRTKLLATWGSSPYFRIFPMDGDTAYQNPVSNPAGAVRRSVWRPDGSEFAVSHATSPYITRYNSNDLSKITEFASLPGTTGGDIKYSPDGRYLAMGYNASTFASPGYVLYDLTDDSLVSGLPALTSNCTGLCFTADSSKLVLQQRTSSNVAQVLDIAAKTLTPITGLTSGGAGEKYLRLSPDGSKMAISRAGSPYLVVYDTATFTEYTTSAFPNIESATVNDIRWIDNNTLVVSQGYTRVYDVSTPTPVYLGMPAGGHTGTSFECMPSGARRKFAGVVTDGGSNFLQRKVRAIDRTTGRPIGETVSSAVDGTFELIVFSPNPAIVYCVGEGAEITKLSDSVTPVPL